MARALLVGCGCHGRRLAAELAARGWAVRGTTRTEAGLDAIEAAGAEAALADPDRVGSLVDLVADVTVVAWLLAEARGSEEQLRALRCERLPSALGKLVDTPVKGFVYEAGPSAGERSAADGEAAVVDAAVRWRLPVEIVRSGRDDGERWVERTTAAIHSVVGLEADG